MIRWPGRDDGMAWAYKPTMAVLDRLGLIEGWQRGYSGWAQFTPLGKAVRNYLEGQGDGLAVRTHLQEQSNG